MIRRPPRSTLFPLHDALPISPTTLPSETPAHLKVATATWDYERREVMIPMRDGVRLHTVILVPKGAKNAPILLTRSEEHTSELQSRLHLVCRLLLEKKKDNDQLAKSQCITSTSKCTIDASILLKTV